jgi:hypothetical protein
MKYIIFFIVFFAIVLYCIFKLLQYLYGKDYKKWKPIVFSKDDTFKTTIYPNKGKRCNNSQSSKNRDKSK